MWERYDTMCVYTIKYDEPHFEIVNQKLLRQLMFQHQDNHNPG